MPAWEPQIQALTEHLGGGGLDASLLALPLCRVIRADHPKMVATTRGIVERLGAGKGLLYCYLPDESPDGLLGHEGARLSLHGMWETTLLPNGSNSIESSSVPAPPFMAALL